VVAGAGRTRTAPTRASARWVWRDAAAFFLPTTRLSQHSVRAFGAAVRAYLLLPTSFGWNDRARYTATWLAPRLNLFFHTAAQNFGYYWLFYVSCCPDACGCMAGFTMRGTSVGSCVVVQFSVLATFEQVACGAGCLRAGRQGLPLRASGLPATHCSPFG